MLGEHRLPTYGCDPGHGGRNAGARARTADGATILEKNINWRIAEAVRARQPGVVLTREGDETVNEWWERARRMRRGLVDFVVSVHCDSAPGTDLHGLHAYHRVRDDLGGKLARYAVDNAPQPLRLERGGVIRAEDKRDSTADDWKSRAQRIVENYKPSTTVLLECGYLSNGKDLGYLITSKGTEACADLVVAMYDQYRHLMQGA